MVTRTDLIRKLRSTDNKVVLQAIEELRANGWLQDGTLHKVPLCHAQLDDAVLLGASLEFVDLHQAHMEDTDLSGANLNGVRLSRARLQGANFSEAVLDGVDLFKANLEGAVNLSDAQLMRAKRLSGAIMPDGSTYDGRYNLAGDLDFAKWGRIDVNDPQAMADFLRVPLEDYLRGQELAVETATGTPA